VFVKNLVCFILLVGLASCSNEPDVIHLRTVKGKKELAAKVDANALFTVKVEGMSCEMGCGGSIRKELKATGAVDRVEFDFVEGRKVQTAKISFDDKKINESKMLSILSTMNEKQFKVQKVSLEKIEESTEASIDAPTEDSEKTVEISEAAPSFALPNLFDVLKYIIQ
jgi:copper chaperone CopZ